MLQTFNRDVTRILLAYLLLVSVVGIRFFTETLSVLPGTFNFIDLGLVAVFLAFFIFALIPTYDLKCADVFIRVVAFVCIFLISVAVNFYLYDISLKPALLDLVTYTEPIIFFIVFVNIGWNDFSTKKLLDVFLFLGLLQIPIALFQTQVGISRMDFSSATGMGTEDLGDSVSGTFGLNSVQMIYYIILVGVYLLGLYVITKKKRYLIPQFFFIIIIYATGSKIMWIVMPVTFICVCLFVIKISAIKKLLIIFSIIACSLGSLFYVGKVMSPATWPDFVNVVTSTPFKQIIEANGKVRIVSDLLEIYREAPNTFVIGVGPGSFLGRGFKTYVNPVDNYDDTNVTLNYLDTLPPSIWAEKYTIPLMPTAEFVTGSGTFEWPFNNYVSLLAELGIIGFLLYMGIYYKMFKMSYRLNKEAFKKKLANQYAISLSVIVGMIVLFELSFFDNWLQTSRVTVPLWLLILCLYQTKEKLVTLN